MAVGLKEIAKDLNLGLSTVAQALGGTGTISPRTRRLVSEHAAKLGYTPNRNAQRMRSSRTGTIGLIVPDVVLSPYVEVVQHLFQRVEARGCELYISLTEFFDQLEDRAFKSMLASRVDGIIAKVGFQRWDDVPPNHYLRRAKAEGVPTVLYSNPIEGSGLPFLEHPTHASARLIVRHLASLGHTRLAVLLPAAAPFGPAMRAWIQTITDELATCGLNEPTPIGLSLAAGAEGPRGTFKDYINQNHPQHAVPSGRTLFKLARQHPHQPTALIAYSDAVAIGAISQAIADDVRVGKDIAIAGCGLVPSSHFSPISLTTVDRRPLDYAERLLNLLTAHMDSSTRATAPLTDRVEPVLVVGDSTAGN